ncbi:MAG: hypothetical protein O2958_11495 [Gemmatimonadetes bacterium]|nr:hypothetical protein [Gemmatimonadota bacterium]
MPPRRKENEYPEADDEPRAVADPTERLGRALEELYGWYDQKQAMLGRVLRDLPNLPALAEVMGALWSPYMESIVQILAQGWGPKAADGAALRGALRLAVDFNSWQILSGSGLESRAAAELATRMVTGPLGK